MADIDFRSIRFAFKPLRLICSQYLPHRYYKMFINTQFRELSTVWNITILNGRKPTRTYKRLSTLQPTSLKKHSQVLSCHLNVHCQHETSNGMFVRGSILFGLFCISAFEPL